MGRDSNGKAETGAGIPRNLENSRSLQLPGTLQLMQTPRRIPIPGKSRPDSHTTPTCVPVRRRHPDAAITCGRRIFSVSKSRVCCSVESVYLSAEKHAKGNAFSRCISPAFLCLSFSLESYCMLLPGKFSVCFSLIFFLGGIFP